MQLNRALFRRMFLILISKVISAVLKFHSAHDTEVTLETAWLKTGLYFKQDTTIRAVPRIFCLWGQTPHTPHRGLPYADRVSSWTLILFSLLHRKLPLRRLEKKTPDTDTFSFKLS